MSEVSKRITKASDYIHWLESLDSQSLAQLRRAVGDRMKDCRKLIWLSGCIPGYRKEISFLVATLLAQYKTNDIKRPERPHSADSGNFGDTFARVINERVEQYPRQILDQCRKEGKPLPSIVRRMHVLLDSDLEDDGGGDLPYRLRQLVRMAVQADVGINWPQFFLDLQDWSHPERRVQKEWARSFFAGGQSENDDLDNESPEPASDTTSDTTHDHE